MSTDFFLTILFDCSFVTSIIVQQIKKYLKKKEIAFSSNVLAELVGIVVGAVCMFLYYFINCVPITVSCICYAVVMGIATAFSATVGYDKVKQTLLQIDKIKGNLEGNAEEVEEEKEEEDNEN